MAKDLPGVGDTSNTISGGTFYGHVFQGRDFYLMLPSAAPLALAQLPPLVTGFTGRDGEMAVMTGLLDPAGEAGAVLVSAVAGLAGVGKTSLAVQAGHAAREHGWYRGGVLFINLHGYDETPVHPAQALDALLRALGVPAEHIPPEIEARAALYRSALARINEPVLVIADNASSEAQVRPLLPGPGPHRVIITSRHTLAGLGARLLDVTVLDETASLALLDAALRAARPDDDRISNDPAAAGRLTGSCGGLPLALQIAAAILKADPVLGAGELAGELAAGRDRLAVLRYEDGSGAGGLSVEAAFELSYHRLDESSAQVFRLLTLNPGADVSIAAAGVVAGLPASEMRRMLAGLARAHLIEAAPGVGSRWRMHDLVRLYAQRLSDASAEVDGREQACDRLLRYYLDTARSADKHLRVVPGMTVPPEFTGRADALAWLDTERPGLVAAVSMAAETGRDQIALDLALVLTEYLDWRRRFDDKLAVTSISIDVARRIGDRRGEGMALTNLGNALAQVRRFEEAVTAHQDAVAIFRETGDRRGEGTALNNLGISLQNMGRSGEAVTAHQDAAAIFRETGDRHGEGKALGNLGNALQDLEMSNEAVTACQDAVAIFGETGDRHGEGTALNNLGLALQEVGRFEEAVTAHQDAAAIFRETGDRHGQGQALNNLGLALQDLGRFEEAVTAHQDAAALYRETGDRHGQGQALNNLGLALQDLGRFDEAITILHEASAIFRETGDRQRRGSALDNLGAALQEVGRFDEAITTHQDAAAIFRDTGDRHGEGQALGNLGLALQEVGRFDEAITAHQGAAAIFRATGDRHGESVVLDGPRKYLRRTPDL